MHKPIDPRTPVLFAIAEANGFRGQYVALLEEISKQAEARLSRDEKTIFFPLAVNESDIWMVTLARQ